MARVVLDPGVIISGLLNPDGPPGRLLDAWVDGEFDLVVSPHLLEELTEVLSRPKLASRLDRTVVSDLLRLFPEAAVVASEGPPAQVCRDPDDDYLVAPRARHRLAFGLRGQGPPRRARRARRGAAPRRSRGQTPSRLSDWGR